MSESKWAGLSFQDAQFGMSGNATLIFPCTAPDSACPTGARVEAYRLDTRLPRVATAGFADLEGYRLPSGESLLLFRYTLWGGSTLWSGGTVPVRFGTGEAERTTPLHHKNTPRLKRLSASGLV